MMWVYLVLAVIVAFIWRFGHCRHRATYVERQGARVPGQDPLHAICLRCGKDLGVLHTRGPMTVVPRFLGYDKALQEAAELRRRSE